MILESREINSSLLVCPRALFFMPVSCRPTAYIRAKYSLNISHTASKFKIRKIPTKRDRNLQSPGRPYPCQPWTLISICSLPSLTGFRCAGLMMEGLSIVTLTTQKLLHLEASNFAHLFKNEFCMLSNSMNIWDALILSQHIVQFSLNTLLKTNNNKQNNKII